jgi:hypothetical protein
MSMCVLLLAIGDAPAMADGGVEFSQVSAERLDNDVLVSAQVAFELTPTVEDAMLKGIPMVFVVQAEITRERWYWYDKKVASAERYIRIAYQPLTRRWRLNVSSGADRGGVSGLALNQSFESLEQALGVVRRQFRWKVARVSDIDNAQKHRLELRFKLDLSQLPRPFQIGAIGQSDWDIAANYATTLVLEPAK